MSHSSEHAHLQEMRSSGKSDLVGFKMLLGRVLSCKICSASLPLGARPVLQVHPRARILIASQAPGRRVHNSGIPFNDPSGDHLREWMGIGPDTFYDPKIVAIVPMGFCYPGTGKTGDLAPRPECAPAWRIPLLSQLHNIELTLVIGQYAQAYHLGTDRRSLTEIVRSWREFWPRLLPLPHPSPRNRGWLQRNPWFRDEILPALRQRVGELL